MRRINLLLLILSFNLCNSLHCQTDCSSQIQDLMGDLISETEEEGEATAIFEQLVSISQNPFEVNSVEKEDLESLIFISDFQIYTFLEYREKYGRILSIKELHLIPGFNSETIEKLKMFLYAGSQEKPLPTYPTRNYSSLRIQNRYIISTPAKNGFLNNNDSLNNFLGKNYSRLLKVRYGLGKNLSAGITMESDAGEAFNFEEKTLGFDFYSGYVQILKANRVFSKIILGDFRLSSGLGLVQGFGFGSKSTEAIIKQKFTDIKAFTSSAESGFYRGLALKLDFNKFESIIYFSGNRQTANIDDEEDSVFNSLDISGLHRNLVEKSIKNNLYEQNTGIVLSRINNTTRFSYNMEMTKFDEFYEYKLYPNRNSKLAKERFFLNHSISYSSTFSKFTLSGEMALDKNSNPAIEQIMNAHLHPLLNVSICYRYFSPKYIALHSHSFSESSGIRNEKGFYLGIESFPFRKLILNAYLDFYSFPWMRYNDTAPFTGIDFMANTKWLLSPDLYVKVLLKKEFYKEKSKSIKPVSEMTDALSTRFSIQTNYEFSDYLNFRNKFEMKQYQSEQNKQSGYLLYQELNRKYLSRKLSVNFRYTMFDIPDWAVRIYSWEHDLLYSFSTPLFYRKGQNILINIRYSFMKMKLGAKAAINIYTSEYSSGSGIEERSGRTFSTWKVQWIYSL